MTKNFSVRTFDKVVTHLRKNGFLVPCFRNKGHFSKIVVQISAKKLEQMVNQTFSVSKIKTKDTFVYNCHTFH